MLVLNFKYFVLMGCWCAGGDFTTIHQRTYIQRLVLHLKCGSITFFLMYFRRASHILFHHPVKSLKWLISPSWLQSCIWARKKKYCSQSVCLKLTYIILHVLMMGPIDEEQFQSFRPPNKSPGKSQAVPNAFFFICPPHKLLFY